MKKLVLIFTFCFLVNNLITAQDYRVQPWPYGKQAAVSLTFDDILPGQFNNAMPKMDELGIPGTFFIITSQVGTISWTDLQSAANKGHEIGSHTVTAPTDNLHLLDSAQIQTEIEDSYNAIMENVKGQKAITIGWPSGKGGGTSDGDKLVRRIADDFYVGARNADVPGAHNLYDQAATWDGYTNYYLQVKSYQAPVDNEDASKFAKELSATIADTGWVVVMYHGIDDASWGDITKKAFENQMDSLNARKDSVWIATFSDVVRFHKQVNEGELTLTEKEKNDSTWTFTLTDTLSVDSVYCMPVTINLAYTDTNTILSAKQDTTTIDFNIENDSITFTAIPDAGDIVFKLYVTPKDTGTTSINQLDINQSISVYPNPANDVMFVKMNNDFVGNLTINIVNMLGQRVKNTSFFKDSNTFVQQIGLQNLKNGLYFIEFNYGHKTETQKLIIK